MTISAKVRARKWLASEIKRKKPSPSAAEIRRKMGWDLVPKKGKKS